MLISKVGKKCILQGVNSVQFFLDYLKWCMDSLANMKRIAFLCHEYPGPSHRVFLCGRAQTHAKLSVNASSEVEELKGKPFLQDTLHIFEFLSY